MSLWSRLFRRTPPPAIVDRRHMNEDWRAGDLAVCVDDDWLDPHPSDSPAMNDLLRVSAVIDAVNVHHNVRVYALMFHGKAPGGSWATTAFRKALLDSDEADAEFTAALKGTARFRLPSHAPASAMSAGTAETAQQAQGQRPASAVAEGETPNPDRDHNHG